jgi:hypothetical protein
MKHYPHSSGLMPARLPVRARGHQEKFKAYESIIRVPHRSHGVLISRKHPLHAGEFEAGTYQLAAAWCNLTTGDNTNAWSRIEDSAKVISRMVDLVMIRTPQVSKPRLSALLHSQSR